MIQMTTWKHPRLAKKDKWAKYQPRENTTTGIWGREIKGKYLTKSTRPGGEVRRQIGYIKIGAKYRKKQEQRRATQTGMQI